MPISYRAVKRLGLGAHLAAIVALAVIPTSLLVIEFIDSKRRAAVAEAELWAANAAGHAAEHHRQSVAATRVLINTAARLVAVADMLPDCQNVPVGHVPAYTVRGDGQIACEPLSALLLRSGNGIAAESALHGSSIDFIAVPDGNTHSIRALSRIRARDNSIRLIHAELDFGWLPLLIDDQEPAADVVFTVLHGESGLLVHRQAQEHPFASDVNGRTHLSVWAEISRNDQIAATATDVDGVERIFGTARVPETGVVFIAGVSRANVLSAAQRALVTDLAILAIVLAITALIAWLFIERTVLRSVRALRDAAVGTANGDYGRRIRITDGPVEIRELSAAFNDMTAELEHLAFHDQLTGLANRRLLSRKFEGLVADGRPFALLEIDLDGFKPVNDLHGHDNGDRILAEVARRLAAAAPANAIVGRSGGDEFIVLIPVEGAESLRDKAVGTAETLLRQIGTPYPLADGTEVSIGGSIGMAFWPQNGPSGETLYKTADEALYKAKRSGRNRYSIAGSNFATKAGEAAA